MKRRAAAGVDGVTWEEYGRDLEENLARLHQRLRRGAYRAKPSRRVYIPKTDGRQRPLGIAALEDKIVQGAVAEVMNAIYEEDFLGFSYGFRPGRNQHQALDALAVAIGRKKVNWVLDADIRSFFDVIDRAWMRRFIEYRITDRRLRRLIEKWLNAGVMEDGKRTYTETGTPQGATISHLPALRLRPVGQPMAAPRGARRCDPRPLCGRYRGWLPASVGSRAIPSRAE
jgi:group II intron reverse transcriptase/maturase